MHEKFLAYTEALHPKFEALIRMEPVTTGMLPPEVKGSGVYMFSENNSHLYVGRTRNVRSRYGQHTRTGTGHNNAPFAFKLARETTGILKSTYKNDETSRPNLMLNPEFLTAFNNALVRMRAMEFRFVEEADPTRQCLLEIYASVVCGSPYNDFNTH
ncbi:GIY-YIG nuclease family protein [Rhizobium laguerreae]|uniref:GIY-YIG nuclease family protein n=1 Tax=Rhizobium laguerreae TaxID=1076926 RepID=UPI001C91ECBF|nr:GIY-YIG nuclease family protein [Rhizobium laguerreae]MBY3210129.1 GIY-YIG nuclease family protein [Rhizobium laguerreae]MBY3220447.1 GIY-YIG nuclease family protein [Rhizobium laguerreae]